MDLDVNCSIFTDHLLSHRHLYIFFLKVYKCTITVHIHYVLRWFNVVYLNVADTAPDSNRNGVGDPVSSCDERENGNYASTSGCSDYVTCTDGEYVINTCADNLFWDDAVRRCEFTTSTCTNGQ